MTMKSSEYIKNYNDLKSDIITDIWYLIKDIETGSLDITEKPGIPAIVTAEYTIQASETIDEIVIIGSEVIAIASCHDDINEYNLDIFEVPMLISILESVEKNIEILKKLV